MRDGDLDHPGPGEDWGEVAAEATLVSGELGGVVLPAAPANRILVSQCNPLTSAEEPLSYHINEFDEIVPVRGANSRVR